MNCIHLGRSGLHVSPLCLGTMNFGGVTSVEDSFAIMDKALDLGINFFDTADVYGGTVYQGYTEEIIGKWLAERGQSVRDRIVLATKFYNPMKRKGEPEPNRDSRSVSALKIMRQVEDSLRRLQVETIDLYQMHHIDRDCPWQEAWQAFDTLVKQGKIIYVGSSNFAGWDIATANQEARRMHVAGLISEQSIYNLENRMLELEVIPACRHYGVGLIPYSPLAAGLLGGALEKHDKGRRANEKFAQRVESKRKQLEQWESFCQQLGHQPADVALAWLLHNPVVSSPIIGPRTMDQLTASLKALDIKLDAAALQRINEIWPGPGGEAPNAYAW